MSDPTNISRSQKLLEEMNAKYGVTSSQPAPQQAQQLAHPPVQIPQQRGLVNDAMSLIKGRQQQIDKAAGYACGGKIKGHAQGGLIKGPGTATSDSIPAKVKDTGENILVSTEERILSKEQDALLGKIAQMMGFESVDQLLESGTGKPVGPTIKGGKRGLSEGGSIYDPAYDAINKIPEQAFPNTMAAIQSGGDAAKAAADAGNYGGAIGQVGRGAISGIAGLGSDLMNSAAYALDPAANALKTFVTGDSSPARSVATSKPMAAQGITSSPIVGGANSVDAQEAMREKEMNRLMTTGRDSFTAGGKNYTVNPTSQDGIQKVTGGSSPLYTNINPEQAVSGLNNQTIGQPADQAALGITRYENANKIRGEMIANRDKDIPAGGYGPGILGNGSLGTLPGGQSIEEWNRNVGVKTQLGLRPRDRVAYEDQSAKNEIHRQGQELSNETQRQNAGLAAQAANNRDQVTMRGQDINERGDMLRYGNPLDAQAKQLSIAQAQKIAQLQEKAAGGDEAALKELIVRGALKTEQPEYMTNVVGGGVDPVTNMALPQRLAVTEKRSGASRFEDGQQNNQAVTPKAGEVRGGYRFKGGNPADKAAWEKA